MQQPVSYITRFQHQSAKHPLLINQIAKPKLIFLFVHLQIRFVIMTFTLLTQIQLPFVLRYHKTYNLQILMISPSRKQSQDEYNQAQQCKCSPISTLSPQEISENLEELNQCYCQSVHSNQLINIVYRCHNPDLVYPYASFLKEHHPELTQPQISTLYPNKSFPDLLAYHRMVSGKNAQEALHIPPLPKNFNNLLDNLFKAYGYIPNFQRFLMFYPKYLERHIRAQAKLLQSDKIDPKITYFLALAAAAEKGSVYMMARYSKKFFKSGGQREWISNGSYPKKLWPIMRLNRKMSHCVWVITNDMILDILENESYQWSVSQLAHIVQILAFAHNDSAIALALGLLPEDNEQRDLNLVKISQVLSAYNDKKYDTSGETLEKFSEMLRHFQQIECQDEQSLNEEQITQEAVMTLNQLKKSMRKTQSVPSYIRQIGNQLSSQEMSEQINILLRPLLRPFEPNERRSGKNYPNIDYSEYNYKFMAYPILNNLTQNAADRLQSLIQYAETMTYGNFGSQIIKQTKKFRKSVRYFGESLCGYTHQGYDYKNDSASVLTTPLKFYIRLLMLSPLHINKQVLQEIQHQGGQIECFDLGHIAILVATAKMELELTLTVQAFEL